MNKRILGLFLSICVIFTGILPTNIFAAVNSSDESAMTVVDSSNDNDGSFLDGTNTTKEQLSLFSVDNNIEVTTEKPEIVLLSSTENKKRDIILMLDISDSMNGTPLTVMKQAAIKFCTDIMNNSDNNRIALVVWDYDYTVYDFSDNIESVTSTISAIRLGNGTKTDKALQIAENLMDNNGRSDAIKNIVLMTDGLPTYKEYSYSGPYTADDYPGVWNDPGYECANSAYGVAQSIMQKYSLYTLGFFHSLSGNDITFGRRFLTDIQNAGYYEVINAEDLEFVFGDIADDIINEKKTGTFMFPSEDKESKKNPETKKDFPATYYYDDNYFSGNASDYNPSLSTMSLCFALSAFGSNLDGTSDYTNKSRNAKNLLDAIDFNDIETNNYFTQKPSEDSMGVVVGHKDIMDGNTPYTLIALATRGGGYEAEWAGNFTIGTNGQHQGFKTARDEAYSFLTEYINKHREKFQDNIKIWMAGYSRGGATVNLLAGKLDDERQVAGISLSKENLYAYCFEPPMGALPSEISPVVNYNNIHNIVNPSDLVPKVAPRAWSFARYGVDEPVIPTRLTSSNTAKYDEMLKKFIALNTEGSNESLVKDEHNNTKHIVDTFQAKRIDVGVDIDWNLGHFEKRTSVFGMPYYVYVNNTSVDPHLIADDGKDMSAFLDDLILSLAVGIEDRKNYTEKLQSAMRLAMAQFMGGGYESYKWDKVPDILYEKLSSNLLDIAFTYVMSGVSGVEELITGYLFDAISEAGIDLEAYASLPSSLKEALASLVKSIVASLLISQGDDLVTLGYNANKLFFAHYPELCMAWLQMQDENYTPEGHELFVIDAYRVIRINCPVNIDVFDESGTIVAQFIDDIPQDVDSSIVFAYTSDGEKVIYLPADQDYNIEIVATDDGELNYSVSEFSYESFNYSRLVNYNNIPITKGETLEASIEKFLPEETINTSNGSERKYTLSNSLGDLTPDIDLSGAETEEALFSVSVESNNTDGGTVIGGGAYTKDSFAQVSAIAFENCEFEGWYDEDDMLVSNEVNYRFSVQDNTHLIAKFTGTRPLPENGAELLTIIAENGGSITEGAEGYYTSGSVVTISAEADKGYQFVKWTASDGGTFENSEALTTTFIMPENATTVTATFKKTSSGNTGGGGRSGGISSPTRYTITISYVDGDGSIVDTETIQVSSGTTITEGDLSVPENYILKDDAFSKRITKNETIEVSVISIENDNNIIEKKYINGYNDGTFMPDNNITRAEVATIIYNMINEDNQSYDNYTSKFSDISSSHWARNAIGFNVSNAYMNGDKGSNKFRPDDNMTRAELAQMLYNLDIADDSGSKRSFSDISGHWGETAITAMTRDGVINGYNDGTFKPNNSITRAEAVTMISRLFNRSDKWTGNTTFRDVSSSHWAYKTIMNAANGYEE